MNPTTARRLFRRVCLRVCARTAKWLPLLVFAALPVLPAPAVAAPRDDTLPLKSAAPRGLGPVAVRDTLTHVVLGTARVYGSAQPDLFVLGGRKPVTVNLFKWLRTSDDGAPVFAPPVQVEAPFSARAFVFQTPDGVTHALWHSGKEVRRAVFDPRALAFMPANTIALPDLPAGIQGVAALPNPDGSCELILEFNGDSTPKGNTGKNASSPDWRPYDAAGISTQGMRYRFLAAAHIESPAATAATHVRQISPTRREVYWGMHQITPVDLGDGRERGLVTGGRLGVFTYYPNADPSGLVTPRRAFVVGRDGNILRHPSVSAGVMAYPRHGAADQAGGRGLSDLIAAGEGGLYFYKFTGEFTTAGSPIYEDPSPLLQENADLYAGTLPAPSVCDWDGDGVLDFLVGNSEGFVLFFKNIGTNAAPAFLPGERMRAAGRDIHLQAGYSGSVQGTPEARWGYNSPTVFDWNGDGLPDIIMGDITGNYTLYLNRGAPGAPRLDAVLPLYCDGLDLHGTWRCRAAVARLGGRIALVIVDGDDQFHLYWRIDDRNVADGGKLTLADGSLIDTSYDPAGGTGRCKLSFFDADADGLPDLVIGTGRRSAIPDKKRGWPMPSLGQRTLGTPLLMRNTGTLEKPVFATPVPFVHKSIGVIQPGGSHERGAVLTELGGDGPNLLTANEGGQLFLYLGKNFKAREP
ncbi:VCBS repeat-containing protein [Termitidicoccus mucosus]|uniref:FG-GAP protein n=1 Tax=Termitidicoccus mucosus TaxID=1184151 RepID=A0A178IM84_9BACT|nr:hypothetical protein AW736_00765 [Opitutaceae bacterium TSB47]